jgi:hypothetical protein
MDDQQKPFFYIFLIPVIPCHRDGKSTAPLIKNWFEVGTHANV